MIGAAREALEGEIDAPDRAQALAEAAVRAALKVAPGFWFNFEKIPEGLTWIRPSPLLRVSRADKTVSSLAPWAIEPLIPNLQLLPNR